MANLPYEGVSISLLTKFLKALEVKHGRRGGDPQKVLEAMAVLEHEYRELPEIEKKGKVKK